MNTEHVEAGPDVSDVQLAETFLNHRVLVVPICDHDHGPLAFSSIVN
jgi:hypothetical protein